MPSPQQSKRDRGRVRMGLPPKQTATKRTCSACGEDYWNAGAHFEACRGRKPLPGFQCGRCLEMGYTIGRCRCGGERHPVMSGGDAA